MPFSDLVERNGGQMLRSFAQGQYMKKMEFHSSLSKGVCSALSTHWVVKRSLGQDFYKRIETPDGRNEVAMLQEREYGLTKANAAFAGVTDLVNRDKEKLKAYRGPDRGDKIAALQEQGKRLVETRVFLQEEKEKEHRFLAEYVESNTGMPGDIESDVGVTDAVQDVSKHEGFVIFGMNGEKGGHAVAMYHTPGMGFGSSTRTSAKRISRIIPASRRFSESLRTHVRANLEN